MQEQIIKVLTKEKRALSVHELNDLLGLSGTDAFKELLKNLNEMEDNLLIYRTNHDNYMIFNNSN